jgi:hypothetical protein
MIRKCPKVVKANPTMSASAIANLFQPQHVFQIVDRRQGVTIVHILATKVAQELVD